MVPAIRSFPPRKISVLDYRFVSPKDFTGSSDTDAMARVIWAKADAYLDVGAQGKLYVGTMGSEDALRRILETGTQRSLEKYNASSSDDDLFWNNPRFISGNILDDSLKGRQAILYAVARAIPDGADVSKLSLVSVYDASLLEHKPCRFTDENFKFKNGIDPDSALRAVFSFSGLVTDGFLKV